MHVSGVLLRVAPGELDRVEARLAGLPGVEVHQRAPERAVLVLILEAESARGLVDRAETLRALPGVADLNPVFHGFTDDADDLRAPVPATTAAERLEQPPRAPRSNAR